MRICDLVTFSKENYFNGSVQTEWFYDQTRVRKIAASYVFHGPKYYGVSTSDLSQSQHKLIDTASFSKNIADKLYSDKPSNSFVMTIAGYGTGKSHLAVCLGALFSGNRNLSDPVIDNIEKADLEIGTAIKEINVKKNLILVLNGMSNFNLDAEVLKIVRKTLKLDGIDDSVLQSVTKAYDISRYFIKSTFSQYQNKFEQAANEAGISKHGTALMDYMLSHAGDGEQPAEALRYPLRLPRLHRRLFAHPDQGQAVGFAVLRRIEFRLDNELVRIFGRKPNLYALTVVNGHFLRRFLFFQHLNSLRREAEVCLILRSILNGLVRNGQNGVLLIKFLHAGYRPIR